MSRCVKGTNRELNRVSMVVVEEGLHRIVLSCCDGSGAQQHMPEGMPLNQTWSGCTAPASLCSAMPRSTFRALHLHVEATVQLTLLLQLTVLQQGRVQELELSCFSVKPTS